DVRERPGQGAEHPHRRRVGLRQGAQGPGWRQAGRDLRALRGEAAEVMLDAIQKGKDRAGTISELFKTDIKDGLIGSIAITPSGDPTPPPISISKAAATFQLEKTVVPPPSLIT